MFMLLDQFFIMSLKFLLIFIKLPKIFKTQNKRLKVVEGIKNMIPFIHFPGLVFDNKGESL